MVTTRQKSVVAEAREVQLAIQLINLGVRLQMVESEVSLSRERLLRLYKELRGVSPPKGMLPFSADWFITWQPNIHASLFAEIHRCMLQHGGLSGVDALVTAYKLYLEQVRPREGTEAVLSLTRAWTLLRFMDGGLLATTSCRKCGGRFVVHAHLPRRQYVCGLCHMPSRAGKTRKGTESASGAAAEA